MKPRQIRWLRRELIIAAHRAQIAQHGGSPGIRDEGLLDAALARPEQLAHYEPASDLPSLAAAYLFGITGSHPFIDGNKRVAYAAAEVFLVLNGYVTQASQVEKYRLAIGAAAGELTEEQIADWLRANFARG